jgi:hypothetical protein
MLHACFIPIALCFVYTSWRFYAFSGTNLLTRCHSASSCFLLFLCFRKVKQEIFSELDKTKAKVPIYLTRRQSPKERRRAARRRAHHRVVRATPWLRHQVVWAPRPPSDIALLPINSLHRENPKGPNIFPRNILQATASVDPSSGGSRSSSRHPTGEGNHHRRPSSSPCQPLEWCVSSPPLDHGSIGVARWLSYPPCASCLDLVSCLSWSRSYLCNSTCCVCWDPINIEYYVKVIADLSCLYYLWSCMLSVSSRYLGQVDASDSKREYLFSIVGSCLQ